MPHTNRHTTKGQDMANATIGTIGALNREWETLGAEPLGSWATGCLEVFTTGEQLRSWAAGRPGREVDPVIHALLVALDEGHEVAGRIVLQMMLGKVARIAQSQPIDSTDNRFDSAVAAMWEQIASLPRRHTTSLALRLAKNTSQTLTQARRNDLERPMDPIEDQAIDDAAARTGAVTTLCPSPGTDDITMLLAQDIDPGSLRVSPSELVEITLEWVQRHKVLSATEVSMLRDLHCQDTTMTQWADQNGVSAATVRQRNRRAVQRVRTALTAQLAA